MNTYASFIGTDGEKENYKTIYDKAESVMQMCGKIEKSINKLAKLFKDLLDEIGENDAKEI